MPNESIEQAKILTEEDIRHFGKIAANSTLSYAAASALIASHRALNSRNAKLVHENDELMAENVKCTAAYDKCAIGGNSLASVLIGWDLPNGWQDWTYVEANEKLHEKYSLLPDIAYERYEVWLCWKSIREAGQTLEELNHE